MKRARKIKTWGDVYNAALRRGEDHGSAERADAWERRQVRQTDRLLDKLQDEVARKEMLERAAREGLERKYSERETEIAVDILRKFCGLEYVGCVFAPGPMKGDMIRLRSETTGARVRIRRDELCRLALTLHEKYGVWP